MYLYDPVLTSNENKAAEALGFSLLPRNEVGLRTVQQVQFGREERAGTGEGEEEVY